MNLFVQYFFLSSMTVICVVAIYNIRSVYLLTSVEVKRIRLDQLLNLFRVLNILCNVEKCKTTIVYLEEYHIKY